MSIFLDVSFLPYKPQKEFQFIQRLNNLTHQTEQYQNDLLKAQALKIIPFEKLEKNAQKDYEANKEKTSYRDELLKNLMSWFKNEFFSWVNSPPCDACQGSTKAIGGAQPNQQERHFLAGIVEIYQCDTCKSMTRFPRYNHAGALLESRRGRCGEWAQAFTMCCTAMGFEARFVMDWTDHVWTEVYSEFLGRWIHCDSCENKFDVPLLYEGGWGKQLTYVIAFSTEQIVDVTKRYTSNFEQVLKRRTDVGETFLETAIKMINYQLDIFKVPERLEILKTRSIKEQEELNSKDKKLDEKDLEGRISGSTEWKESRGETGGKGFKCTTIDFGTYPVATNLKFRFTSFDLNSPLLCVGNATISEKKMILTHAENTKIGAIWYKQKVNVEYGFVCLFQFKISKGGADGFAFVIQNESDRSIGKGGGYLGYDGISNALAVEFDTYQNHDINNDPSNNHISIQTCGKDAISSHHRNSIGCTSNIPTLNDGKLHTSKIVYQNGTLSVFLDDLDELCVSSRVDLKGVSWIGFTAATGGLNQSHEIVSWSWSTFELDSKITRFESIKIDPVMKKLSGICDKNGIKETTMLSILQRDISAKGHEQDLMKFYSETIQNIPEKDLFPVLDLLRVSICHESFLTLFVADSSKILSTILGLMAKWESLSNPSQVMLSRLWCNVFPVNKCGNTHGSDFIFENDKVLEFLIKIIDIGLKAKDSVPLVFTLSVLAANLSQFVQDEMGDNECQLAVTIIEALKVNDGFNEETCDNLVRALSNLVKFETFHDLIGALELKLENVKVGKEKDRLMEMINKK